MGTSFVLPQALTIYTVGELKPQLLQYLQGLDGPALFDAAAVQEVGSAGLQLLQAVAQECGKQGRPCQFIQASAALQAAAAALGLQLLLTGQPEQMERAS